MIRKLPRWVEVGAFALSFLAGCVNTVGLMGFSHQTVSHLTGTISRLGVELVDFNLISSLHLLWMLLSFILGSILSGFYIRSSALKLGGRYSFALLVEGLFLLVAMFCMKNGFEIGQYFASMACGLQNALVTTYSGAVIRTTHITGIITDLGIMIGSRLRGVSFDRRLAILYLILISGFMLGGVVGAIGFKTIGFSALIIPSAFAIGLAVTYWFYLIVTANNKSIESNS